MNNNFDLYQELILDHAHNPKNFGNLENPTHSAMGHNPLCGDRLKLELIINNNIIKEVNFNGDGCAISRASASLMTQSIKNQDISYAKKIFTQFHQLLTEEDSNPQDLGKLKFLAGVKNFPMRVKCATLCWHALNSALDTKSTNSTPVISTEK